MEISALLSSARTRKLRIAVLGMGHVGLPTALGMAEMGWEVIGVDDDAAKIEALQAGALPFVEPALGELLAKHLNSRQFVLTSDVPEAIRSASILFVCVGTPQRESGEANLSQVETIARLIAR